MNLAPVLEIQEVVIKVKQKRVVKLFETYIPARTIEQRARRQSATSVAKESQGIETTPNIIKDRRPQGGGKRNGAGRPVDPQRGIDKNL